MTTPCRDHFRFIHPLRVRWSEVDPQNIVFNGNYLTYADVAITEYFRDLGLKYPSDLSRDGGELFVKKAVLEYHAPAYFDDMLDIGIRVSRFGRSSMNFAMGIWRAGELLTSGDVLYVHANSQTRRSSPLPQWLKDMMVSYEFTAPLD